MKHNTIPGQVLQPIYDRLRAKLASAEDKIGPQLFDQHVAMVKRDLQLPCRHKGLSHPGNWPMSSVYGWYLQITDQEHHESHLTPPMFADDPIAMAVCLDEEVSRWVAVFPETAVFSFELYEWNWAPRVLTSRQHLTAAQLRALTSRWASFDAASILLALEEAATSNVVDITSVTQPSRKD